MSKKLNIIEAMKMAIGTKFEVILNAEEYGCLAKIIESKDASKKQLVWDNRADTQVFVTDAISCAIFTPIQKSVSFMEAVQQADKKRFKIVHTLYKREQYTTLVSHMKTLCDYCDYTSEEIQEIILNSKCYFQE